VPDVHRLALLHQDPEHHRVEMQVEVAVNMIQRKTSLAKLCELSPDFGAQLFVQTLPEEISQAGAHRVVAEAALGVNQAGNLLRRQGRVSQQQRQVQAHAEEGVCPGERHGVGTGRFVDHQTGGGENALAMGLDDRGVDRGGAAEIISIHHKPACGWR
jgi:hypothetical protein